MSSTCHHDNWTGVRCLCSVGGRVEHVSIYKRGHYYGSLNNEKYTSVEHFVAVLSRTGFSVNEGRTLVTLTKPLFPDK